jgi:uncharacterized membrane protein AbrB (regulator of aidB expression)
MVTYLVRRLLLMLPTLVGITLMVFMLLALAPGGMPEMSVIAASLGLDAAYVTALHLARVLLVLGAGPLVWRLIAPRQ